MSDTTPSAESNPTQRTRYSAWIGLVGTALVGVSLALPWTELIQREPTGWDLMSTSERLINDLDDFRQARAGRIETRKEFVANVKDRPIPERLKQRTGLRVRAQVEARVEETQEQVEVRREQADESLATVKSILRYTQLPFVMLLVAGSLPLIGFAVSNRRVSAVLALLTGVAAGALTVMLVIVACCVAGLELFGAAIPLKAGFWSATTGTTILAVTGIWRLVRP
jgi:hypothetical protein